MTITPATLSGVVRVAGVPVAGARVGLVKLGVQAPESPGPEELIASLVTEGDGSYRRFAVPLHASGTLEVTVSSSPASPFDITVLRPDGTIGIYASSSFSPLKTMLPVTAGLTYQIDVVHINPSTREFELTTTLR